MLTASIFLQRLHPCGRFLLAQHSLEFLLQQLLHSHVPPESYLMSWMHGCDEDGGDAACDPACCWQFQGHSPQPASAVIVPAPRNLGPSQIGARLLSFSLVAHTLQRAIAHSMPHPAQGTHLSTASLGTPQVATALRGLSYNNLSALAAVLSGGTLRRQ